MRLEHVNLVITDMAQSLRFYQAAFPHWHVRSQGHGEWYGKARHWLHFGDDYNYIAFSDHGEGENRQLAGHQTGLGHFAFVVNNLSALIDRMEQAGYQVDKGSRDNPYRHNVYFIDPDGFEVEFVEYFSDLPHERNNDD
ncbi:MULTISPECIES: VOC family protein [Pseudoalteromonas]|uniref:Glyoxalase n=1 Tax=Pseudoalteromonas amylolytica TaxID=1859457 RepID=A0A1S1MK74_9GAMM|nr:MULTISPECIES: VOC family protein [Pseudoalteromonas]OHU84410.1 glyoxalase [Pseudoalteromonas sp. JW3]OHU87050.1 glyoxalase [Pseudoalteromonas amylolytica]